MWYRVLSLSLFIPWPSLRATDSPHFMCRQDGNSYTEASRTWRRRYQLTDEQRRLLAPTEYRSDGNLTTVLNCTQPFVSCAWLECGTVAFPRPETSVVVTLSMRVKIHELGECLVGG